MSESRRYVVQLEGCDDSTYARVLLHDDEIDVVKRLAVEINRKSTRGCEPKMHVTEWLQADRYDREKAEEEPDDD